MTRYLVRFEYLRDEQADIWELPVEADSPEDAKARIQRNRAPLRIVAVTPVGTDRCYWCGRDTSDGNYIMVSTDRAPIRCCDICWEKRDEGVDIPLDYTEDDREGQPEFNGAFRSW